MFSEEDSKIHPNLHCVSKLLEHVVHVVKLHGHRRLGQCFHNIWFLRHLLQDLLEVLRHCVVGLEQEWLVPLEKPYRENKIIQETLLKIVFTI